MTMNNKVLVKVISASTSDSFDIFIPVNEYVWRVKKLIIKTISNIMRMGATDESSYILTNSDTGEIYDDNLIVINTNIRNGTELLLLNIK